LNVWFCCGVEINKPGEQKRREEKKTGCCYEQCVKEVQL
jgi:hypothetical protein